jgi:hypothetical protein
MLSSVCTEHAQRAEISRDGSNLDLLDTRGAAGVQLCAKQELKSETGTSFRVVR